MIGASDKSTMKHTIKGLLTGAVLLVTAAPLYSQPSTRPVVAAHYPVGVEGLKGASLPPPGLYFRDYNMFYTATEYPGGPPDFDIFACINAPRLIWMTDFKVLGADYGMDVIVPFGYMNWEAGGADDSYFGIGDIQLEPVLLSWHLQQCDIAAGYAVWAPTGDFSVNRPDILAKGFWSHMLTFGGTWYFDAEKTWALSLLNRYEFCHEQEDTDTEPGQVYTLEVGLGKAVSKTIDVGLIGYWQQQTTDDEGPLAADAHDRKIGLGAEISGVCPVTGLLSSLRYACEMDAADRPEGHLVTVTLTRRF
jgi:hypothetical protein